VCVVWWVWWCVVVWCVCVVCGVCAMLSPRATKSGDNGAQAQTAKVPYTGTLEGWVDRLEHKNTPPQNERQMLGVRN